jgi:hypothetical protein
MPVAWEGYDGANNRIEYSAGSDVVEPIGEATPVGV